MNKHFSLHLVTATALAAMVISFGSLVEFTPAAATPAPATVATESTAPGDVETTSTAKPIWSGQRVHPFRPANV